MQPLLDFLSPLLSSIAGEDNHYYPSNNDNNPNNTTGGEYGDEDRNYQYVVETIAVGCGGRRINDYSERSEMGGVSCHCSVFAVKYQVGVLTNKFVLAHMPICQTQPSNRGAARKEGRVQIERDRYWVQKFIGKYYW